MNSDDDIIEKVLTLEFKNNIIHENYIIIFHPSLLKEKINSKARLNDSNDNYIINLSELSKSFQKGVLFFIYNYH